VLPDDVPQIVKNEIAYINDLLKELTFNSDDNQKIPTDIHLKNSRDEEWYLQQMTNWVDKHPTAIGAKKGRSTLYKYALHFFVENIALQSENSLLSASELSDRVKNMRYRNGQLENIERKLKDIDDQLTFNTAMTHFYGRRSPLDADDSPMPLITDGNDYSGITDIFSQPTVRQDGVAEIYASFKKQLGREKALLKKKHGR
jgi:hypothetical protein